MNPYEPPEITDSQTTPPSRTWQILAGVFFLILGAAILAAGRVPTSAVIVLALFLFVIVIRAAVSRGNRK